MNGSVLIIEDIYELADLYRVYLEKDGLSVTCVPDAEQGLSLVAKHEWDLVILDINLPGMDGFQFLEQFRKKHGIPVMILSARSSDEDIILGLGSGADDFVVKPCPPKVLSARVRAHIRRADRDPADDARLVAFGPFLLDRDAMVLRRDGKPIPLSPREFGVLSCLIEAEGKPLSPTAIYTTVWKQAFGDPSAIGVYMQRLRRKLEDHPDTPRWLQTVQGMGYRFESDPDNFPDTTETRRS